MNEEGNSNATEWCDTDAFRKTAEAKARLLDWADERDAHTLKARSSAGSIVTRGTLVLLGGVVLARVFSARRGGSPAPLATRAGRQIIRLALVARAGAWLFPYALSAMRSHSKRRIAT